MDRTRAAEGDHGVAPGIVALFSNIHARGRGHVLIDDGMDARGGLRDVEAERAGDLGLTASRTAAMSSAMWPPRKKSGER